MFTQLRQVILELRLLDIRSPLSDVQKSLQVTADVAADACRESPQAVVCSYLLDENVPIVLQRLLVSHPHDETVKFHSERLVRILQEENAETESFHNRLADSPENLPVFGTRSGSATDVAGLEHRHHRAPSAPQARTHSQNFARTNSRHHQEVSESVETEDHGGAVVDAMASLFHALDPNHFGYVPAADFKLVLSLVMGETEREDDCSRGGSAEASARRRHHEMSALVHRYHVRPPEGDGEWASSAAGAGSAGESVEAAEGEPPRYFPFSSQTKEAVRDADSVRHRLGDQPPSPWSAPPSWPVEYERFVLDARLSRLQGIDWDQDPPVEPWTDEQKKKSKHPTALAHAVTETGAASTWKAHVAAFKARRLHAVTWTMTEGSLRAKRALMNRDEAQRHLVAMALRARTLTGLMGIALNAQSQVQVHVEQKRWLQERLLRCRRHLALRAEAFAKLGALMVVVAAEAAAANIEATNQNRAWVRRFHVAQAYKWLAAMGQCQKARVLGEKKAALDWLVRFGQGAVAVLSRKVTVFCELKVLGRKARDVKLKREVNFLRLHKKIEKAQRLVRVKHGVFEFLESRAEQSHGHRVAVKASVAFLLRLGEEARNVVFREELARKWLRVTGIAMAEHAAQQRDARAYLAARTRGAAEALRAQQASAAHLAATAQRARVHTLGGWGAARATLAELVHRVRVHRVKRDLALEQLGFFVDGARARRGMERAALKDPERLEKLTVEVRSEDKKNEADRRFLEPEERLRLEMVDVFNAFDLDGSGEIDPLEFRAIVEGGKLFAHIPLKELEDVFVQMDRDQSGAISFDEFYEWFLFETDRKPMSPSSPPLSPGGLLLYSPRRSVTAAAILPARQRAARRLYLETLNPKASPVNDGHEAAGPNELREAAADGGGGAAEGNESRDE